MESAPTDGARERIYMDYRLLGFFSGFPNRKFPCEIAGRLREELIRRDSFVCVSAWPADYERNDIELINTHGLFEDYNMPFARQLLNIVILFPWLVPIARVSYLFPECRRTWTAAECCSRPAFATRAANPQMPNRPIRVCRRNKRRLF